jgi:O-acetyl-ADP-ribose deacetylase (regulator of RNase III)
VITYLSGNILDDDAEALVNPVNCVGVAGAGLAKQFKERFPGSYKGYAEACRVGALRLGEVFVTMEGSASIVHFPTKGHWKDSSELPHISAGLRGLLAYLRYRAPESVALPKLGCGLGGLDWRDVHPLIVAELGGLEGVEVRVYGEPVANRIPGTYRD